MSDNTNEQSQPTAGGQRLQAARPRRRAASGQARQAANPPERPNTAPDDASDMLPPKAAERFPKIDPDKASPQPATGQPEEASSWIVNTIRGTTGWMISMVLHLTLILLLAVVTLGVAGRETISLLLDHTPSAQEMVTFDIVIDGDSAQKMDMQIDQTEPIELPESSDIAPMLTDALSVSGAQALTDEYESISPAGIERSFDSTEDGATAGVKFFGVKGKGTRFVFIIDCSGSMDEYKRWRRATRELKSSINNLMEPQEFLVLLYNSYTVAMNNRAPKLVTANRENQTAAINWLAKQQPGGTTYVATSLKKAFELRPDAIFLLSDGEFDDLPLVEAVLQHFNGSATGRAEAQSYERLPEEMIPVHTISLGGKSGAWTMQKIAEQNQGTYTVIDD